MKYKQALSNSPSDFKRLYGVTLETCEENGASSAGCQAGQPWQLFQANNTRPNIADIRILARVQNTISHSKKLGVHESTAQRTVKRIEDMLIKSRKFSLPSQREMVKSNTEIEIVIVDVAETEIERPKKNRSHTTVANRSAIR